MGPDREQRTRAGWTLPVTIVGTVVALAGWHRARTAGPRRDLCHTIADLSSFTADFMTQRHLPSSSAHPSCAAVDRSGFTAWTLTGAGALLFLIGLIVLVRRARRATRAGQPWWIHRAPGRLAAWLDRIVLRRPAGDQPRFTARAVTFLATLLLLGAVIAGHRVWTAVSHAREVRAHHRGQLALARLPIPPTWTLATTASCTPNADRVCATSRLNPEQVAPLLQEMTNGRVDTTLCALIPPANGTCPITFYGTVVGYRTVAIAFQHLVLVHGNAKPPLGAVPAFPHERQTALRLYYLGTDVSVELLTPTNA